MPLLSFIHFWPYSGFPDQLWSASMTGPADGQQGLDEDALLRSSRRVCEQFSEALVAERVEGRHSEIRLVCAGVSASSDFECVVPERAIEGWEYPRIRVPSGFAHLDPATRAEAAMDVLAAVVGRVGELRGLNTAGIQRAIEHVRECGFEWTYVGPWRSSPDRRLRARVAGYLHHDGLARLRVEFSRRADDTVTATTREFLGWTTPRSFSRASKALRWDSATTVTARAFGPHGVIDEFGQIFADAVTGELQVHNTPPSPLRASGDTAHSSAKPGVRIVPEDPDRLRISVGGGGPMNNVPYAYWEIWDALGTRVQTDPAWLAWWRKTSATAIRVWIHYDASHPKIQVRIVDDRISAAVFRPVTSIPIERESAEALARADFDAAIERIRQRCSLDAPPDLPDHGD